MNTAASGDRLHEGDAALAEIGRLMLRSLTDVDMLRDFDLDGAEAWSDTAACYRLGESEDEALRAIRTDIQMIDYLGAIKHDRHRRRSSGDRKRRRREDLYALGKGGAK